MISFFVCIALLVIGYLTYGKFVSNTFGPDDRETPAITMEDGVDYVVMPTWRIFLIQLLNIAGLGPIWGAVGGALWGPAVFLWITFGTIVWRSARAVERSGLENRRTCERTVGSNPTSSSILTITVHDKSSYNFSTILTFTGKTIINSLAV